MKQKSDPHTSSLKRFAYWTLIYEFVVVFLFAYFVRNSTSVADKHLENYFPWFQDVNTMMLIGFGFLMTFVRTHSWGSLGFTFIINAIVVQSYIIFHGFWGKVFKGFTSDPFIYIDIPALTLSSYAVAAILIALGALLGRVTPAQMLFLSVCGCFVYSLNETIVYDVLGVADVGGSITIHTFGGYFGLAISYLIGRKNPSGGVSATVSYHSTMFSMLGTLFLWMFWPSFNSGVMKVGTADDARLRLWTITNTLLSLTASCISTFATSKFWRGKLHMEDILNATLAGGVVIGACSNLLSSPIGAMVMGATIGVISTMGFWKLGPWLTEKGLIDVCGIHNLHAIPGFVGGMSSAILFACEVAVTSSDSGFSSSKQAGMQAAGTLATLGIAVISGSIVGLILNSFKNIPAWDFFQDKAFWDTEPLLYEKQEFLELKQSYSQPLLEGPSQVNATSLKTGSKANE